MRGWGRGFTASEAVTVSNAIRTASELDSFMRGRGRPYPPQHVDLDAFLHDPAAAPAPSRALASLRWLVNQGQLGWELGGLTPPTHVVHQGRRRKSGQATAVAPPMLRYLEERVERLHATGEPRWSALLASWIAATGCLRQKHIARSYPRKLTKSTLHCECTRGNQKKLRQGFSFGIPACFSTGWPWAQHVVDKRDQLPANVKRTCGLCFDVEGKPWHMREITLIAREIFVGQIEHPETLTSYSWRRWAPSMGQALGFDPQQLASLSDWQDKTSVPENAAMPLHYSGARYALSLKSKYSVLSAVPVLGGYESWELIPPSAVQQAKAEMQDKVDKLVQQDSTVLWAMPISASEVRARFQLTTALKRRAAEMREQSESTYVVRTMPASVNGRTMLSFMKNGDPLCAAYQQGLCGREEAVCLGKHRCAAVLKSGRVCGGHHAGGECHDRRVVRVATSADQGGHPEEASAPSSGSKGPKPPEPDHPPPAYARSQAASPPPAKKARPPVRAPAPVLPTEEQQLEDQFDHWATGKKTAQRPTPIWKGPQGGTLWLSGLPVASTRDRFPQVTLQIVCFHQSLQVKGGVQLPGTMVCHVCPSDRSGREPQWRVAWPLLKNTLLAGESALIHCVAGRHRGGGVAVLARSILAQESLDESEAAIKKMRDIDLPGLFRDYTVGPWLAEMRRSSYMNPPLPAVVGYLATPRSHLHLMVDGELPLCFHKQNADKAPERLKGALRTKEILEAAAWLRPLCQACVGKAPAGVQLKCQELAYVPQ